MKILVIGGTGHVGSEVVKELQKQEVEIRVLVPKEGASVPLLPSPRQRPVTKSTGRTQG